MEITESKRTSNHCKLIAAAAAVLLLSAQLLALSHYHNAANSRRITPQTQAIADADLCGLCTLALHAPIGAVSTVVIHRPQIKVLPAHIPTTVVLDALVFSLALSRAPPLASL
jgi:hypothetical protein